jgi:predicted ATPase
LGAAPECPLEPWVRQEIARLVPELDRNALPLPTTPEEKARLAEAFARLVHACREKMDAWVFDEAHWADPASLDLHLRVQGLLVEQPSGPEPLRLVTCFRIAELPPGFEERLREHIEAGLAAWLEVEPLPPRAVRELLASLEAPNLQALATEMSWCTGGNPLFISDALKALLAAGRVQGDFLVNMPVPERVAWLIQQRLERLSPEALRLARIIAAAGKRFRLDIATRLLELSAEQLAAPWKELERARILRGATFSYEWLRRCVVETLPRPVHEAVVQRVTALLHQPT